MQQVVTPVYRQSVLHLRARSPRRCRLTTVRDNVFLTYHVCGPYLDLEWSRRYVVGRKVDSTGREPPRLEKEWH